MNHFAASAAADLDAVDWQLLDLLQSDGRLTFSELGRRVSLSAPAVTERVRRLEQRGVITGYSAQVDASKLGLPIEALVRVRVRSLDGPRFRATILPLPTVTSADHTTGDDCWLLRVRCRSTGELEALVEQAQRYGETTTSLVFSSPVVGRPITRPETGLPAGR
ncbi:Lrp/AsnC family transcriptional regulator [Amycolatopsis rhabdoformis]|uniref:Lrp/AsnC family transcriptional regulator n=1 Tax=Amycolatopsis rhabdoformis TaxID=1448059 RepID=A0ABZ1I7U8_9PSEU|nr:Lrp/AsnC family transcriptional regulator [Amycolatopsis rhabdoformis]WSE29618.1 Lrp/AsnC family transcriptional regulator [Amycolatopsis rhabdoformis]